MLPNETILAAEPEDEATDAVDANEVLLVLLPDDDAGDDADVAPMFNVVACFTAKSGELIVWQDKPTKCNNDDGDVNDACKKDAMF